MTTYTQDELTKLRAAAAKGVMKVRNSVGEEVTYRTLQEMHLQISIMERALAPQASVRHHFPTYSKGA